MTECPNCESLRLQTAEHAQRAQNLRQRIAELELGIVKALATCDILQEKLALIQKRLKS